MKILVTGASGFVGCRLISCLANAGCDGFAVSRRRMENLPANWRWIDRRNVFQACDSPEGHFRVDCVVHLEVKQHVFRPSVGDIASFKTVNVIGTQDWLSWCARLNIPRFVYFSSVKAGACLASSKVGEAPGGSDDTHYGWSKLMAEDCVRGWGAEDRRRSALILRPAVIYGPGNEGNMGAMVRATIRNRFFLVGEACNRKSIVSLRNVVAACHYLLMRMIPGVCEIYNVVDPVTLTLRELDVLVRRAAGKCGGSPRLPVPVAWSAAKVGDIIGRLSGITFPINTSRLRALCEHSEFSCDKLIATGFQHPQSTEEGIAEMVSWFRSRTN